MIIIRDMFLLWTFLFGGTSLLANFCKSFVPENLLQMYLQGKCKTGGGKAFVQKFDISKRYFKHFYVNAVISTNITLLLIIYRYYLGGTSLSYVYSLLDAVSTPSRKPNVSAESAILCAVVFACHCYKRFYESWYLSIYSDSKFNITAYILGMLYYPAVYLMLLAEAEGFVRGSNASLNWSNLSSVDWICALIILLSTYMQYRSNVILANLRKDKKGVIVTKEYKVPRGELFEYIAGPLQLTEILIYVSMAIILRNSSWFITVLIFVAVNQVACAHMSHIWLRKTFKNYPPSRKIIVPYVF